MFFKHGKGDIAILITSLVSWNWEIVLGVGTCVLTSAWNGLEGGGGAEGSSPGKGTLIDVEEISFRYKWYSTMHLLVGQKTKNEFIFVKATSISCND